MRYTINLSGVNSRDALHDALEKALPLPEYYGRNLDALYDVLTSLPDSFGNVCEKMENPASESETHIEGGGENLSDFSSANVSAFGDTADRAGDNDAALEAGLASGDASDCLDEKEADDQEMVLEFVGVEIAEAGEAGDYIRRLRRMCSRIEQEEENLQFIWK